MVFVYQMKNVLGMKIALVMKMEERNAAMISVVQKIILILYRNCPVKKMFTVRYDFIII